MKLMTKLRILPAAVAVAIVLSCRTVAPVSMVLTLTNSEVPRLGEYAPDINTVTIMSPC